MDRAGMKIAYLVALVSLTACNKRKTVLGPIVPNNVAPGSIELEISSDLHNWRYEITPSIGKISELDNSGLASVKPFPPNPSGEINCVSQGSKLESSDGKFVAECSDEFPGEPAAFSIAQTSTNLVTYRSKKEGQQLHGIAWSPNSNSVAMLTSSKINGNGPLELFWAFAGHPVPHMAMHIEIVGADGKSWAEYLVRDDVRYGMGRIIDWRQ